MEENTMQNATNVDQTLTPSPLPVESVTKDIVSDVPALKPEFAIHVLKRELDDLQLRSKLLLDLNHDLIKLTEATILDRISTLTLEAVNRFLSSQSPGEVQKRVSLEKTRIGKGTVSIPGATV